MSLTPVPLRAAAARTALVVGANVVPVARARVVLCPVALQVRAEDVAAGYVQSPSPIRMRIDSNSVAGFALDVVNSSAWVGAVIVGGLADGEAQLNSDGGTIIQRWRGTHSRVLDVTVRFRLVPGTQPGVYGWPLHISARPL